MTDYADILSQNAALVTSKANAAAAAAATTSTGTDTSASSAFQSLSSDESFFLKMLTTQLQNQDPTQPMDVAQMTQQIAQYTGVEQQVKTNSNLEKLLANSNQSQISTAVGYIGREVESEGTTSQVVQGQGAFAYILPSAADSAEITITNASGSVVFQGAGDTKSGRNIVVWDGINSTSGAQEPDGMYTLSVKALDAGGAALTADIRSVGIVSGVQTETDGTLDLNIGTTTVSMDKVLAVRAPTRIDTTTSDSTTGTTGTSS